MYNILRLMLKKEVALGAERGLTLEFSEEAVQWMLAQNDEPEFGARPLRRIIRRSVREPLADFLLRVNPPPGTGVRVSAAEGAVELTFAAMVNGKEVRVGSNSL